MKKLLILATAVWCLAGCSLFCEDPNFLNDAKYVPCQDKDGEEDFYYIDLKTGKKADGSKKYKKASYFFDGIAIVEDEDGYSQFIDDNFNLVSTKKFDEVTIFQDGRAWAMKDDKLACYNKKGEQVFKLDKAIAVSRFNDGVAVFAKEKKDGEGVKYGLIDKSGKILIDANEYDAMGQFGFGGVITVGIQKKDGGIKWGICKYNGDLIVDCEYDRLEIDTYAAKRKVAVAGKYSKKDYELKYGVIDYKNREVIGFEYYKIFVEPDGTFLVGKETKNGRKCYWIDKKGDELFDHSYQYAAPFYNSKYSLAMDKDEEDDEYGIIDKKGEWVVKPKFAGSVYTSAYNDKNQAVASTDGDLYGVIDKKGEFVVKAKYTSLEYIGKGYYIAKDEDDNQIILDYKGEVIFKKSDVALFDPDKMCPDYIKVEY